MTVLPGMRGANPLWEMLNLQTLQIRSKPRASAGNLSPSEAILTKPTGVPSEDIATQTVVHNSLTRSRWIG